MPAKRCDAASGREIGWGWSEPFFAEAHRCAHRWESLRSGGYWLVTLTLFRMAVSSTLLLWLVSARPTYALAAMLIVLEPTCTQVLPLAD